MGKHVVGYLTWKDFLDEVRTLRPEVIRVQPYHLVVPKSNPPLVQFFVDAAFLSQDGIHVARFFLGSEFEFVLRNKPARAEHFQRLMNDAEDILRAVLSPYASVRPGVLVGANRVRIDTAPDGLWRREKEGDHVRLIPEAPHE